MATSVPWPRLLRIVSGATMALDAIDDRAAHAHAVLGDLVDVEADATIAYEHLDGVCAGLGIDVDPIDLGVLGGVDHRLPGSLGDRGDIGIERCIADRDHLDGHLVGVLDVGGRGTQRRDQRVASLLVGAVEPRPQLTLLATSEGGHGCLVAGVLLQQRQGLQHGVVQVRCHIGALLRTYEGAALLREVAEKLADPRAEDQREADQGDAQGSCEVDHRVPTALLREEVDAGERDENATRSDPDREPHPAGLTHPAPPGDVVELPPDHREADDRDQGRSDERIADAATGDLQEQEDADANHADGKSLQDLRGLGPIGIAAQALAGRGLEAGRQLWLPQRHEPPQQQIGDDPEAVEPGRDDEGEADVEDSDTEMIRETGRHAAHQSAVSRPVGTAIAGRAVLGHPKIVTRARAQALPGTTLVHPDRRCSGFRVVPDGYGGAVQPRWMYERHTGNAPRRGPGRRVRSAQAAHHR